MVKPKTYFIYTFGCQMNKADSERIAGDYQVRGFKLAKTVEAANEIIINTCSVRQRAEDRVIGLVLNLTKKFKSKKHQPKIILTGCMIHHGEEKLRQLLPQVDEILPISEVGFNISSIRRDKHHAWVPISNGCNSFCTFCIVPFSRGREKSRPESEILKEVTQLTADGYTELTLVGQNVNSYGLEKIGVNLRKLLMRHPQQIKLPSNQSQYKKFKGIPPFVKLLAKICRFNQLKTIRFLTSNPWDFSDALIDFIKTHPQIDRFIYLPVQSGSNRILKLMNRGYTRQDYLKLVKKLTTAIPDITLGTDIIVGFPGETKKDFAETVALAKQVNWQVAFVAQYSPRPSTVSAKLYPDSISPAEKKRRWLVLEKLINKKHLQHRPQVIK
ncbi:MAG: MiaB/RimO family radical SAM methylthiotransferase [Patescibacteria group bacterium]|nr:MiaB/RimO family radical SAM methylthiotransferase [Patescibacteria group bacterium]